LLIIHNIDTDGDFLSDLEELQIGTDKTKNDTDGDGLWDGSYFPEDTINVYGAEQTTFCDQTQETTTNPLLADTDGDGTEDGEDEDPCGLLDESLLSLKEIKIGERQNGRLEVFAIGVDDNTLYHNLMSAPGGQWGGWKEFEPTDNFKFTEIEVRAAKNNRLDLFAIDTQKTLWRVYQTSESSGWVLSSFGGTYFNEIEMLKWPDSQRLEVIAIGTDSKNQIKMYKKHQHSEDDILDWSNWRDWGRDKMKDIEVDCVFWKIGTVPKSIAISIIFCFICPYLQFL